MSGRNSQAITPFIPTNDDLIEAYRRSGAPADFDQIVARFAALVFNECRRVTRNAHDAEDAAQLTFLALAMELKAGVVLRQPGAWLQRVAKRQALKLVRGRGRRQRRENAARRDEAAPPEPVSPAQTAADDAHIAGVVRDAIDSLPEHYRLPIVLHYFGGMKLEAIARELNVSKQAVGTRLHRARKMVGDRLSQRGISYDAGTLAGLIALIVPAGVVAAMVRSTAATAAVPGSASSAAIASGVSAMLRSTGAAASAKPLVTLFATVSLSAGVGLAFVGPSAVVREVRDRIDVGAWIDWLTGPAVPKLQDLPTMPMPSLTQRNATDDDARNASDALLAHPLRQTDWTAIANGPPPASPSLPPRPLKGSNLFSPPDAPTRPSPWVWPSLVPSSATAADARPHLGGAAPSSAEGGGGNGTGTGNAGGTDREPIYIAPSGGGGSSGAGSGHEGVQYDPAFGPSSSSDYTIGRDGGPVPFMPSLSVGSPAGQVVHIAPEANVHVGKAHVGVKAGDVGTIVQDGGTAHFEELTVGERGTGYYTMMAGSRLFARHILLGDLAGSHGTLTAISDASVNFLDVTSDFTIGGQGEGRLLLGSATGPGTVFFVDTVSGITNFNTVVVRSTSGGSGLVRGWGSVQSRGVFVNNDRVVADGFNRLRTLDLSSFSEVINTIENPVGHDAGWYVRRGGRIALPAFVIQPVTATYTWGESSTDPVLDLVNSLRFVVHGQSHSAALQVSLRTIASGDPLAIPMPSDVAILGLWQFDGDSRFDPASLDMLVRYDDRLSRMSVGEAGLELMAFSDGAWHLAEGGWRDDARKILGGHFDGRFDYLAVTAAFTISGGFAASPALSLIPDSRTPEPTTLLVVVAAAGLSTRRRRLV